MKNKKIVVLIVTMSILIIVVPLFLISNFVFDKLVNLNYSNKAVSEVLKYDLFDEILNNKYSKTLDTAFQTGAFNKNYLDVYFEIDNIGSKKYIDIINVLSSLGYDVDDIKYLIDNFDYETIDYISKQVYLKNLKSYLKYNYFDIYRMDRYKNYRDKFPTYSMDQIIWQVNMDLDLEEYENFTVVDNPDDELVLVNKYNKLPDEYSPNDLEEINTNYAISKLYLRSNARKAFEALCRDAHVLGLYISAVSSYRNLEYQNKIYEETIKEKGIIHASKYSAKPRFSEHETGLTVDVMGSNKNYLKFEETDEYIWLKDNAHNYGFIIRYPRNEEAITKYMFESWHIRYVGKDAAKYIYENKITLEEYIAKNKKR